ncbi:hypothetical protein H9P43_007318 [Blastocladiella emersonii ATCC 22665]|nr:hypothetical protein H9P43_007318 [Blastocladiella emersonii ATCC 22665]
MSSHVVYQAGTEPRCLVVLPGLLTSARASAKIQRLELEAVKRNWHFLTLDYYGCFTHAGSLWSGVRRVSRAPDGISIDRWADDIVDAFQALPVTREMELTVVGLSMGFSLYLTAAPRIWSGRDRAAAGVHLVGVGASPDPRARWRACERGDDDGYVVVPSEYAPGGEGKKEELDVLCRVVFQDEE